MPVVNNGLEGYHGDQLVVERRDSGLVAEGLRRMGIAATESESNDRLSHLLRLTLLDLAGVGSAAAGLRQDSELVESASLAQQGRTGAATVVTDLDLVLFALRRSMRAAYHGWQPTLGKNRLLGQVQGSPYIKGGIGVPGKAGPVSIPRPGRRAGTRVAVLDTELFAHPDLVGRYLGDSAPYPDVRDSAHVPAEGSGHGSELLSTQGHATFVAGLIVQRAPSAELIVRKVLGKFGTNSSSWEVAKAMVSVLDDGVAVLNLSLGCSTMDGVAPLTLQRAVEQLIPSVVVVAAAGNNGAADDPAGLLRNIPVYPAASDGVVAVGAYDAAAGTAGPAEFSPLAPWVDLLAPGVRVQSTYLPGKVRLAQPDEQVTGESQDSFGHPGYATWDGTSFAAANVTGAIAEMTIPGHKSAYGALAELLDPATAGDIHPAGPA